MRLNQWLVRAGAAPSRRRADDLIVTGVVRIDGTVATLGAMVEPTDQISLNGQALSAGEVSGNVVLFHKPPGVICSHAHQAREETIFDLLPPDYASWKIVGRLDKDSEGLVILTDDGNYAQALVHPSQGKSKRYSVWLDKPLSDDSLARLNKGIKLEEGVSRLENIKPIGTGAYELSLQTGWNQQIRRTFQQLGYVVDRLRRLELGPYQLGNLRLGEWRVEGVKS